MMRNLIVMNDGDGYHVQVVVVYGYGYVFVVVMDVVVAVIFVGYDLVVNLVAIQDFYHHLLLD